MNPPQPPSPSGPPASRFVAIWVPDWPVVALTMEARQRHRHPRARQGTPHLPDPATEPVAVVGARGVLAASAPARRAGITTGIDMWAGEYDQLVAEGGAWSHATGHLHTLLNPSVTHYGFAASSGYSVGQGLWSRGGSADSTGWSGTYDITLAGGTDEAPAASVQTDRPAPSGSGSSSGFQQIIRSFWR